MKISIREAKYNDLEQITELLKELLESIEDSENLSYDNIFENLQVLINDINHYLIVAENNEEIIGFINFCIRTTCLHKSPSALIDELVVSKNYRNQGIGEKLILTTIDKCKKIGCCEIEVTTEKINIKAREFYQSMGFVEIGIFMEKDLK